MVRVRKVAVLFLVMFMVVGLFSGCSSASNETTGSESAQAEAGTPEASKEEPITISIWWASQDEFKEPLLKAIAEYESAHPNVTIEPEWLANFDYYENYKIALAGDTAPDIVKIDHVFVQSLGYNGQILELGQFGAGEVKDQFVEAAWKANMYQDDVYALPFDANTLALMYNQDLLDRAGVAVPTTYDELVDVSMAINNLGDEGVFGYTVPVSPQGSGFLSFQFNSWSARNGGQILNNDWSESELNSAANVQALQQVSDLVTEGVIPANVYLENEFYEGMVGLLEMGCWNINRLVAEEAVADFGVAPLVTLKDGVTNYAPLGLYSLAVTKGSEHEQAAYDFAKFLATDKELQLSYAKQTSLMPSLNGALDDEFFNTPEWEVFIEQFRNTVSRPGTPVWPSIDKHLSEAIQKVLLGESNPTKALTEGKIKCDEELAALK